MKATGIVHCEVQAHDDCGKLLMPTAGNFEIDHEWLSKRLVKENRLQENHLGQLIKMEAEHWGRGGFHGITVMEYCVITPPPP